MLRTPSTQRCDITLASEESNHSKDSDGEDNDHSLCREVEYIYCEKNHAASQLLIEIVPSNPICLFLQLFFSVQLHAVAKTPLD
jgi:hypothetical protein